MTRPLVSAVIVNYNGLRFLPDCITSLQQAVRDYPLEIVVVDNASTDGSQAWLEQCPGIVLIASTVNLGFTGGNNLGASRARGERLLFINNDTRCEQPLDPLLDALDEAAIGLAGCRLVYGDGRQQFSFGYDHTPGRLVLSWLGLEKRRGWPRIFRRMDTDAAHYLVPHEDLAWVSGACFVMRRSDWAQLQGFDTRFFMYCEDVDLCLRVRQHGGRIAYRPSCTVTHYEGAGRPWIGTMALTRTAQSYLLFTRKHHGVGAAAGVAIGLGALFVVRAAAFGVLSLASASGRSVRADKAAGYFRVGRALLASLGRPVIDRVQVR